MYLIHKTLAPVHLFFNSNLMASRLRSQAPQALLEAPLGVVKLMDLLGDSHEAVRNEALLLMVGLTHASVEIKQFAAFEGAFEKLMKTIRQVKTGWCQDTQNTK